MPRFLAVYTMKAEAVARLFEKHLHFTIFPGNGVDIMPFLTGPDLT